LVGQSIVAKTEYTRIMVPAISDKKTWPPVKIVSSHELEPKARAAGQLLPKMDHRKRAPRMEPHI